VRLFLVALLFFFTLCNFSQGNIEALEESNRNDFCIFDEIDLNEFEDDDDDEEEFDCQDYCLTYKKNDSLFHDLLLLKNSNDKYFDQPPIIYNHYGQVGYFAMPSARVRNDGDLSLGYSSVPPYNNLFIGFQPFSRLEAAFAYRIFTGIQDVHLSQWGFGDYADKGCNLKVNFLKPEDTDYTLPGLAFGWDDFLGSKMFSSQFIVMTQEWPQYNFEGTIGYGWGRIQGLFAGIAYTPFRKCSHFLKGLTFIVEHDAVNYSDPNAEPHPDGRYQKIPFNYGLKYTWSKYFQVSLSQMRGRYFAVSSMATFDIGSFEGLFPKIDDPPYYRAPINIEPISKDRTKEYLIEDLAYALDLQGFDLIRASLEHSSFKLPALRLRIINRDYIYEPEVHKRLGYLLALLAPVNISEVIVVISSQNVLCQEYRFPRMALNYFATHQMSEYEFAVVSPVREVTFPKRRPEIIFDTAQKAVDWGISPLFSSYFGSSRGKFKFAGDIGAWVDGFVWYDVYYKAMASYSVYTTAGNLTNYDLLNPSVVLNVHSDVISYYQQKNIRIEQLYLQKSWTHGCGFYSKVGLGFFDIAMGGFNAEALYYPVDSNWAIGLSGSILWKRNYDDFGFMRKIRKYVGDGNTAYATWVPYDYLSQYFLDLHYRFVDYPIGINVTVGQFLAGDFGMRTEVSRYFPSGLRVYAWYTFTNGHDRLNGTTYHDKGVGLSLPLDVFFTHSSKTRFNYSISAWLRDVGYRSPTGRTLYDVLYDEREYPVSFDCCR
jgi:hypothetical protein